MGKIVVDDRVASNSINLMENLEVKDAVARIVLLMMCEPVVGREESDPDTFTWDRDTFVEAAMVKVEDQYGKVSAEYIGAIIDEVIADGEIVLDLGEE